MTRRTIRPCHRPGTPGWPPGSKGCALPPELVDSDPAPDARPPSPAVWHSLTPVRPRQGRRSSTYSPTGSLREPLGTPRPSNARGETSDQEDPIRQPIPRTNYDITIPQLTPPAPL